MRQAQYRAQVALFVQILPLLASEPALALKGATAFNLFSPNLPRLSVEFDLTDFPLADNPTSLAPIEASPLRLPQRIAAQLSSAKVEPQADAGGVRRLLVWAGWAPVKVGAPRLLGGVVLAPEVSALSPRLEDDFGCAEVNLIAFADLFAGKMAAALDRQHPLDLYDERDLLATEGLTRPLSRPSWSKCSATAGRWPRLSHQPARISRTPTPEPSPA